MKSTKSATTRSADRVANRGGARSATPFRNPLDVLRGGWRLLTGVASAARDCWTGLRSTQQLVLGFASYVVSGTVLLCTPLAVQHPVGLIDHVFTVVSAISTTGLTTVSVADSYTFWGELVILVLFQLGGVGYMTLSSLIVMARGRPLSELRIGVLRTGFSVPHYFVIQRFIVHLAVFTVAIETLGTAILWWRFSALGVAQPLWSAVFHTVSAFATAGFSLNNDSLVPFADDWVVNVTIGLLCYLGAIGFIVVQDVWYSLKWREHMITFTSKVILATTGVIFVLGTILLYFIEPGIRDMSFGDRWLAAAFQVMTASSTAGFNTIPIGPLSRAALLVITFAMLIGASPSGTGGGIKTTGCSALLANLVSVMRGREKVVWLAHEVPLARVLYATAATSLYLGLLGAGLFVLCLVEDKDFLALTFEAASALGTVGLSMGVTGDLSWLGKATLIVLMFAGRCGPLTLGLALLRPESTTSSPRRDDLAV